MEGCVILALSSSLVCVDFFFRWTQVYKGLSAQEYAKLPMKSLPPTALLPEVKYEQLATLCGGHGVLARTPEELVQGVISGLANQDQGVVTIVNLLMEPGGQKK